ncbi:hypothetical protein PGN35_007150 [Nodosilinea sp. PGN35]|uniref:hypothetical protein n=1 Tax=Nodosilinea sp. PGN35 TaxID=3020489 RepID=UPI0023B2ECCA|nr:hypothetical protein [Nodosilinea sp. TSF1-S3]MDF0365920.1 hypothetical protein [Nodosilinea sp. TSF1-S3]
MSNPRVESDNYDPHIIPAETAARKEREGTDFKQPREDGSGMDVSGGQTVDKEGLANNYPIEPEMYINEPGDLREEEEAKKAQREAELSAINQTDEEGKVTTQSDERSKGVGQI